MESITTVRTEAQAKKAIERQQLTRAGKAVLGIVTTALTLTAGVLYIIQVNTTSTMGYEIHQNEKQIQHLEDQQKQLTVREAKLKSLQGLEKEITTLKYIEVAEVSYTSPVYVVGTDALVQR